MVLSSTAHMPWPRSAHMPIRWVIRRSVPSRPNVPLRKRMVSSSAFIAAYGSTSPGRQQRRTNRSVITVGTTMDVGSPNVSVIPILLAGAHGPARSSPEPRTPHATAPTRRQPPGP